MRPPPAALTMMLPNSAGFFRRPSKIERRLEGLIGYRRLRDDAARNLRALGVDRLGDVGGRDSERRSAVGIEPDAHRILADAEKLDIADAVDALEHVDDTPQREVRDVELIVGAVRREQEDAAEDGRRRLLHRDAVALDRLRQARQRKRDAVLDEHLGLVEIGARLEGDREGQAAVGSGLAVHVQHVFDPVDFLLDRRGHGVGDRLRGRARIDRRDHNRRRDDVRILRDRKGEVGDAANDDGDY